MDCIFCKIINGDIPAAKVFEDKDTIAFLDIAPGNKGHTLVVPKRHVETIIDMQGTELKNLIGVVQKIAGAVNKAVAPHGYNILMNNRKAAGQVVPHAHIHIIPRFENDGIDMDWPQKKYEGNEMAMVQERIKSAL